MVTLNYSSLLNSFYELFVLEAVGAPFMKESMLEPIAFWSIDL